MADDFALEVKIETTLGHFSNSVWVVFSSSLNVTSVSPTIATRSTGLVDLRVQGSAFTSLYNYSCSLVVAGE